MREKQQVRGKGRKRICSAAAVFLAGGVLVLSAVPVSAEQIVAQTEAAVTGSAASSSDEASATAGAESAGTSSSGSAAAIQDGGSEGTSSSLTDGIDAQNDASGAGLEEQAQAESQNQAAQPSGEAASSGTESGNQTDSETEQQLLVYPENLPVVFLTDAEAVTDEQAEPDIGDGEDGVYVQAGETVRFTLDEKQAQKQWHAKNQNDPSVKDRVYVQLDDSKEKLELLTSGFEEVPCELKNGVYTFTMPQEEVRVSRVQLSDSGVVVIPDNGLIADEDAGSGTAVIGGTDETNPDSLQDGVVTADPDETETADENAAGAAEENTKSDPQSESETEAGTESSTEDSAESSASFTYKSSNEKAAVIDRNGKITGVAPGETVISVYKDGVLQNQMTITIR